MKILVLDDMEVRHDGFRKQYIGAEFVHCYTHDEAIEALNKGPYDLVCLDHDLNYEQSGGINDGEKTGYDVALYIANLPQMLLPKEVLVHSWNTSGARRIAAALFGIGPHIQVRPFSDC